MSADECTITAGDTAMMVRTQSNGSMQESEGRGGEREEEEGEKGGGGGRARRGEKPKRKEVAHHLSESTISHTFFWPCLLLIQFFATTMVVIQTPAMGLAQAGMIRRKNALSMIMQVLTGLVIGSLMWFAFGFSLTFGPDAGGYGIIGNFHYAFFNDVTSECIPSLATNIPGLLLASFQMML
jgi:hypothetical protein